MGDSVIYIWVKVDKKSARWPRKVLWDIREKINNPETLPSLNNGVIIFPIDQSDLPVVKQLLTSQEFIDEFGVDVGYLGGSGIYSKSGGTFYSWP